MRVEASEREARELAEAARDIAYTRPSFAKELYLGKFDLSLIHPHPRGEGEAVAEGDAFIEQLEAFCRTMDGRLIEREAKIPDDYVKGLADLGAFGMKIPKKYGGLGLIDGALRTRTDARRLGSPVDRRASVGAQLHRRARAGQDVRH